MSKYAIKDLWEQRYGNETDVYDYSGRLMKKGSISQPNSSFHPTMDHIRPLSKGGLDDVANIEICHKDTNIEKADDWNHWYANQKQFKAVRIKGNRNAYGIIES